MSRKANPIPDISEAAMASIKAEAHTLCQGRTCETGHGTCALICMDQFAPRDQPHGCNHVLRVFAKHMKPSLSRGGVMRLNAYLKAQYS
jgi:hypothetical protein